MEKILEKASKTVCCKCWKKVKKENGGWVKEAFSREEAGLSHGYCPECGAKARREVKEYFLAHPRS